MFVNTKVEFLRNMNRKASAYEYLKGLHLELDQQLPGPSEMKKDIDETVVRAKGDSEMKHLNERELAFVNSVAAPLLFRSIVDFPGMSEDSARQAFLCESYRALPQYCTGTPARRLRHPFDKKLSSSAQDVYKRWSGETSRVPLTQSCPDFAFREPFPYTIVFEAKYFHSDSGAAARSELVTDAYQAIFYRSLPSDRTDDDRPDWCYEFSCLFAYDASTEGYLLDAWESLSSEVKVGFWEGANVYVMILRGNEIGDINYKLSRRK